MQFAKDEPPSSMAVPKVCNHRAALGAGETLLMDELADFVGEALPGIIPIVTLE